MSKAFSEFTKIIIWFLSFNLLMWYITLGEGNGNPLQYSCLENPRDRGACRAAICGVTQSQTQLKQLSSSSSSWCVQLVFIFFLNLILYERGSPGGTSGKEPTCQCRRHGFDPWVGKILWRKAWQPTPVFLPGESQGWGNLVGCHLWGHTESDTTEAT